MAFTFWVKRLNRSEKHGGTNISVIYWTFFYIFILVSRTIKMKMNYTNFSLYCNIFMNVEYDISSCDTTCDPIYRFSNYSLLNVTQWSLWFIDGQTIQLWYIVAIPVTPTLEAQNPFFLPYISIYGNAIYIKNNLDCYKLPNSFMSTD